jgi:DNA-binding SARP family transcriptional activator/class 3 adenylate cyclase
VLASAGVMEFRVLGPLEAIKDGRALELGGQKQRALLAVLVLEANRVVSSGRLIEALWEEEPPETATKALQVYVSQLRKLLGKERLQTRAPGYLLRVEPDELDVARFQRLQEEGRLKEALALWRGPPLAEFEHHRFARVEIDRLEELRLVCLEERIEQDVARGLDTELVGELESLVREHPLRERARCQLMLALYRSGRQAEALEVYQDARRLLVGELGIEPGRSLRELQQAILNQDTALEWPVEEPPPHMEPAHSEAAPAAPTREVRKTVTAVCVAVSVSSAGDEPLDPEALRQVTGRAFGEVERAVERHGGIVETVAGEALTAVFGLPTVHEDDALRGMRASAELRVALAELAAEVTRERKLELDFRIGVSTGEVVTGPEGGTRSRTTGEPLMRSSRLAQAASRGDILFDEEAWQLVRDVVSVEAVEDAWRLVEVADALTPAARRMESPMVGRERERRRLHDAFDQAVGDNSCQLFTVLGLAGVGKSRLVQEFLGDVAGQASVARGRCLPYGEGITFWPLLEVVREFVGLDDTTSADEARERLLRTLDGEQDADALGSRVAEMIGLAEGSGGVEEGFAATRRLFEVLARRRPLVIVFDDIHWGEPTFLELIEHVADWTRDAPVLLLCLARPELLDVRPGWGGGKLNATATLLEPLSDQECSQLIENLVGRTELAEEVAARIAEAAEGNPLFVEEMLSMLIDDGLLVSEDGRWVATRDVSAIRVPPTIQALIAARLDQLEPTERAVIERAAVAGKVFEEGAVVDLCPEPLRAAISGALGTLVRKDLIRPDRTSVRDRTYRFRHLLIRDAAYEAIPKEERAELHERFGRRLEQTAAERAIEYEEVLGYHLEQAYRYRVELRAVDDAARTLGREAAQRLGSAGRRALLRSDAPAGANLISRAVALLPADDPLRVELVPNVRVVQGSLDLSWADRVLTEAIEAAATTGDRRLAAHALVQRGLLRLFTEREVTPEELIASAERANAVFEELGDELGQARAWRLKAQAHYLARRAGPSADASERALAHVRLTGDRFEEREIVEWLCIALFLGPAPAAEAAARCERLCEESAGRPLVQATVLAGQALLVAMQGDTDEAERLKTRSRAIMTDLGEWTWIIWIASFWWAFSSLRADDPAAGERELRPGYEALRKLDSQSHFSALAHALANAVCAQGRYEEAELLTYECEKASRPNDVHSQILWRSTRAKALAHRGLLEPAEELAHEAVEFAAKSDFHPAHADALMDLAEVLSLAGKADAAATAVEDAIRFYELKGNKLAAARARSRLEAHV